MYEDLTLEICESKVEKRTQCIDYSKYKLQKDSAVLSA